MAQGKTIWQLADENFRKQIDTLMVAMRTDDKKDIAREIGISGSTFYMRYEHPRTMRVGEMRMLSILFEKHGLKFDMTLGVGAHA